MAQGRAWALMEGDQPQPKPPQRQVGPHMGTHKAAQPNEVYQDRTCCRFSETLLAVAYSEEGGGKDKIKIK